MALDSIAVIGFMGSGKTTVGRALANELSLPFTDLDDRIEDMSGLRIPEVFAQMGEFGLRYIERMALSSLAVGGGVVSTSGGCVVLPQNRRVLEQGFTTFFLDAPFEVVYPRIAGTSRPLLQTLTEIELRKLMALRRPMYIDIADYIIDAAKPVDDVLSRILDYILD